VNPYLFYGLVALYALAVLAAWYVSLKVTVRASHVDNVARVQRSLPPLAVKPVGAGAALLTLFVSLLCPVVVPGFAAWLVLDLIAKAATRRFAPKEKA